MTESFGLALLDIDLGSSLISVEALVVGIEVTDLLPIPGVGPFHLHIATPDAPSDQVGPIALSFGEVGDWATLDFGDGITLNAVGMNVGAFTDAEIACALVLGKVYLDLHTFDFPGGEPRGGGFGALTLPEPATALLLGLGLVGLTVGRHR